MIIAGFIVILTFILIFYNENKIVIKDDNGNEILNQELKNRDINEENGISSQKKDEEEKYNPALELLYTGKMDGIEFGIGTNSTEIIEKWGEPDYKDNYMGGLLLSYDKTYFLTDGIIIDDSISYGTVGGIYYTGEATIYGIHIGMLLREVEEILGKPNHTYISDNSELYFDNNLIVKYKAGAHTVIFEIENGSETVQSISLWKEEK
ncbi:DUF4309 domain-containing protein [Anaerovirgula multivorans]|uniref:DUF4309 domain-containing protein n=1 Tax=Anaerovirgula multivorans TaxID=312168 RepID=UPI001FA87E02|nr:DUF4309 domain-containing protein [Anaerovirgula multivorans]